MSGWFERSLYKLWGWLPLPKWLRTIILWIGNPNFMVGVTAVILDEQGRVLLFKHTYRPDMPWGLPGGWLKYNEEPVQAVEREVFEESGMFVRVLQPIAVRRVETPGALEAVFLARYVRGEFRPSAEVSEAKFFTMSDMPPVYASARRIIRDVLDEKTD